MSASAFTTRSPDRSRAGLLPCWLLLASMAACSTTETLGPEAPSKGSLAAGQTRSYLIPCEKDQFLDLAVDQRGVDVVVTLKDPNGSTLAKVDSLFGASGEELILALIPASGQCILEIESSGGGLAGDFRARIRQQRAAEETDRRKAAAAGLFSEGVQLDLEGRSEEAIGKYEEALERWTELGDRRWQSVVNYALGQIYANKVSWNDGPPGTEVSWVLMSDRPHASQRRYEPGDAVRHLEASLELAAEMPELEARAHLNLGDVAKDLLQLDEALRHYETAVPLWRSLGDGVRLATTLNNLGLTYRYLGELQEALEHYGDALTLWRDLGDRFYEAHTLLNRGLCYDALGRTESAFADVEGAYEIWTEVSASELTMAWALTSLGRLLTQEDRLDEAHDHLRRALNLRASHPRLQAVTKVELGAVYSGRGEPEKAEELYRQSLDVFRALGDKRGEAVVLFKLGELREESDPLGAEELHGQARVLSIEIGNRELAAAALFGSARAETRLGELDRAKGSIEKAIEIVDDSRKKILGTEMRSVFSAGKQEYYDFYVDLLMTLAGERPEGDYEHLAFSATERSRALSLLDMLDDSGVDLKREEVSELLEEERVLARRIEARYLERERYLTAGTDSPAAERLSGELRGLLLALDEVRGRLRARDASLADLTHPRPISVQKVQNEILDGETLLLEYHLGEPRSFLFAISKATFQSFTLSGRHVLEEKAQHLHNLLTEAPEKMTLNRARLEVALADLGEELLSPAIGAIEGRKLVIVAEGALQHVPFSALALPSDPSNANASRLVDEHEIVFSPSAAILGILRERSEARPPPVKTLAVVADPVFFDDPRLPAKQVRTSRTRDLASGTAQRLGRLVYSRLEAESILEQAGGDGNLVALGFDATRDLVLDEELRDYRFVHFATHSLVDPEFPEMSSLVFSRIDRQGREIDGFVRIHDVYSLDLRADMAVLSACRTARGKEIRGEGLVTWTHGFMFSGAKRVLVSLWDVDDEATAELMRLFYSDIFQNQLSPPAALRHAQSTIRRQPRWRAPYFWAGFVLQGEFL